MKRLSLTAWIFIGMAAGVVLGVVRPDIAKQLGPAANVFLRLIRSIVAPLIFATLVAGIAGGGDLKRMGRIGVKAIVWFEVVTTLALFLGLAAVNLVRPGAGRSHPGDRRGTGCAGGAGNLRDHPGARFPDQHDRRHGAQRRAPGGGLRVSVRRGLRGHWRQGPTGGDVLRLHWRK